MMMLLASAAAALLGVAIGLSVTWWTTPEEHKFRHILQDFFGDVRDIFRLDHLFAFVRRSSNLAFGAVAALDAVIANTPELKTALLASGPYGLGAFALINLAVTLQMRTSLRARRVRGGPISAMMAPSLFWARVPWGVKQALGLALVIAIIVLCAKQWGCNEVREEQAEAIEAVNGATKAGQSNLDQTATHEERAHIRVQDQALEEARHAIDALPAGGDQIVDPDLARAALATVRSLRAYSAGAAAPRGFADRRAADPRAPLHPRYSA